MSSSTTNNNSRDRRPPDDIRLELFVPFFVPENPFVNKNTPNNTTSSTNNIQQICQESVRRFRSWKTKYFQLIRAIEWCLPDQQALERTITRVKKYNSERYQTFFELDGSKLENAKELFGEWNEEMMNKLILQNNINKHNNHEDSAEKNNSNDQNKFTGLALLCVFGSAADAPVPTTTDSTSVGPNQPPNTADLYEKKKKIRVEDIKANKSFTKSVNSTSRNLRGFLIKNITNPDVIDFFVQRHLLKLMIQMKMMSKMVVTSSSSVVSPPPAGLLRAFVPMVYEPVRRCGNILVIGQTIFLIDAYRCFKEQIFEGLNELFSSTSSNNNNIDSKINKIMLISLGDARDAVLMKKNDFEKFGVDVCDIKSNSSFEFSSSSGIASLQFKIDQEKFGVATLSLKIKGKREENSSNNIIVPSCHALLAFTGDFVSLDSFVNDDEKSKPEKVRNFLSGVIATFAQQQEAEKKVNELKEKMMAMDINNNNNNDDDNNRENEKIFSEQESTVVTNDTLLVPSHGGYSWVTKQLDLSWAGFAYATNKTLFPQPIPGQSKNSVTASIAVAKTEPKIVASGLHAEIKKFNDSLLQPVSSDTLVSSLLTKTLFTVSNDRLETQLLGLMQKRNIKTFADAMFDLSVPLILDTRSPSEFEAARIAGSLSIPFALREPERSSKKAELWLSQLVVPGQDLIIVLPSGNQREEHKKMVLERIVSIIPAPLLAEGGKCQILLTIDGNSLLMNNSHNCSSVILRGKTAQFSSSPSYETVSKIVQDAAVVSNSSTKTSEQTKNTRSFVVDCRTPVEFAQSSHVAAGNIPLSDFRYWLLFHHQNNNNKNEMKNQNKNNGIVAVERLQEWNEKLNNDNNDNNSNTQQVILPSRYELFIEQDQSKNSSLPSHHHMYFHATELDCFKALEEVLFSSSTTSRNDDNNKKQFLIYCAAGYRSRIFMSIFESALISIYFNKNNRNEQTQSSQQNEIPITVADVGNGAIELMSQHAALWTVKDRGIVCVS